ncbi:hypothetical protein Acidovoranil_21340 [Acidovorax sp. FG27]
MLRKFMIVVLPLHRLSEAPAGPKAGPAACGAQVVTQAAGSRRRGGNGSGAVLQGVRPMKKAALGRLGA